MNLIALLESVSFSLFDGARGIWLEKGPSTSVENTIGNHCVGVSDFKVR